MRYANAIRDRFFYHELLLTGVFMTSWHLESKIAQDIVDRAMDIIDINIMDAHGRIVGSGDAERIGKIHEGALLVLSQNRVLNIDVRSSAFIWCLSRY